MSSEDKLFNYISRFSDMFYISFVFIIAGMIIVSIYFFIEPSSSLLKLSIDNSTLIVSISAGIIGVLLSLIFISNALSSSKKQSEIIKDEIKHNYQMNYNFIDDINVDSDGFRNYLYETLSEIKLQSQEIKDLKQKLNEFNEKQEKNDIKISEINDNISKIYKLIENRGNK